MKGLFISEVTQLWYSFFISHFCAPLPFAAFELKMLNRRTELFIEWVPLHPPPLILGLSFVLLMVEERRSMVLIKGSYRNVLNTSKSLQSVSYLCLLSLSPVWVLYTVRKSAAQGSLLK